jgi:hypothetical protein
MRDALYSLIWRFVHCRPSSLASIRCALPESPERIYPQNTRIRKRQSWEEKIIRWADLELFIRKLEPGDRRHVLRAAEEARGFDDMQEYLTSRNGTIPRASLRRMGRKLRKWRETEEAELGGWKRRRELEKT